MATICTDAVSRRPDFSWPVQMLSGLAVTAALVVVVYFLIDQQVMFFVRDHELYNYRFLKWLTRPPEAFVILSPFVLLVGLSRRWFTPWTWAETVAVAAAVSTLCTALAALLLKITFGRSADGFHPFHFGAAYWAFPSGHTACTLSVTVVLQVAIPRWRLCWWPVAGIVAAALIALSYHFVGDILGGAFVGWAVGGTVARFFGLNTSSAADPVNCHRAARQIAPRPGSLAIAPPLRRLFMHRLRLLPAATTLALAFALVPNVVAGSDKLDVEAAAKLNVLKNRLPGILADWNKKHSPYADHDYPPALRFIHRTSPITAKITFLMAYKCPGYDAAGQLVSIYLSYYDGAWTTTRKEVEWNTSNVEYANDLYLYLMLAIDELDEK